MGQSNKKCRCRWWRTIHFDYRLALASLDAGIDKIRLNPGNISNREHIKLVADKANEKGVAIRIGVNAGSLEKEILQKYGKVCPQALVDSALYHASLLEQFDFHNIVVSIKSSDVPTMIKAYTLMSKQSDYPLHLGVIRSRRIAHRGGKILHWHRAFIAKRHWRYYPRFLNRRPG